MARVPEVWIVLLTWNGIDLTRACLNSLFTITDDSVRFRVCVVDNGSRDGTLHFLESQPVHVITNATNTGYSHANNQGIASAPDGADILLLNNDVEILQPDWLRRLVESAYAAPDIGIAGARLVDPQGRVRHAGTRMPREIVWGIEIGGGEPDVGQYQRRVCVDGIVGACMYIRREVIDQVGLLDERFFAYFEDTDYCMRAVQNGWKTILAGDVTLLHHENASSRLNGLDFNRLHRQSQEKFFEKWSSLLTQSSEVSVFWHSLVVRPHGYAQTSRSLLKELDRQGVDLRLGYIYGVDNMEPTDEEPLFRELKSREKDTQLAQVVYAQGDAFIKNSGRYRIGYTMLEVDGLPLDWVQQANQMDEVWTPSQFNAESFTISGVRRPIHVMPLGVDLDHFNPQIAGRKLADRFTFLSVFEWGTRKAPDVLIQAYCREFRRGEAATLVLKVDNIDPTVDVAQEIDALALPRDHPPIVLLLNHHYSPERMATLYRSSDCFVLPSRGEGWGMPILEAMACGLPTIATNWGGQQEFLRPEWAYPLRVKRLTPAHDRCPYYEGFNWAEPDGEQLQHWMRSVFNDPQAASEMGARAAIAAQSWCWPAAAARIKRRLLEVAPARA